MYITGNSPLEGAPCQHYYGNGLQVILLQRSKCFGSRSIIYVCSLETWVVETYNYVSSTLFYVCCMYIIKQYIMDIQEIYQSNQAEYYTLSK